MMCSWLDHFELQLQAKVGMVKQARFCSGVALSFQSFKVVQLMLLKFLSVKEVPTLFWSAPKALTFRPPVTSFIFLVVGLFIFGVGEALIVAAAVGVSPWTVLGQCQLCSKHCVVRLFTSVCHQHTPKRAAADRTRARSAQHVCETV